MIIGVGMDLVEVGRIRAALARPGGRFRARIYTESECSYCDRGREGAASYAARFAAKEAFLKALGRGLADGVRWREIEITREPSGRPGITLTGRARELFVECGGGEILLTLTHSRDVAAATVILTGREGQQPSS